MQKHVLLRRLWYLLFSYSYHNSRGFFSISCAILSFVKLYALLLFVTTKSSTQDICLFCQNYYFCLKCKSAAFSFMHWLVTLTLVFQALLAIPGTVPNLCVHGTIAAPNTTRFHCFSCVAILPSTNILVCILNLLP